MSKKKKEYLNLFKKKDLSKLPACVHLLDDIEESELSSNELMKFSLSKDYNTDKYLIFGSYKPISRILAD